MSQAITIVDAFTDRPFAGNPAAVCILEAPGPDAWLADVAREMNLSETAFLLSEHDAWRLRWFTPAVEVDLCGHATLASAHVLFDTGLVAPGEEAVFETRSGRLSARRNRDRIDMDFPAEPATEASPPAGLIEALDVRPLWTGRNRFDWLIELGSEREVRALTPDFGRLRTFDTRGVIVTAPAETEHDFVSRFFAPAVGVDEDPVTGSAHCCLGPFWVERLGRTELAGYQASRRGGRVHVAVHGDRVTLSGHAVTVLRGTLDAAAS